MGEYYFFLDSFSILFTLNEVFPSYLVSPTHIFDTFGVEMHVANQLFSKPRHLDSTFSTTSVVGHISFNFFKLSLRRFKPSWKQRRLAHTFRCIVNSHLDPSLPLPYFVFCSLTTMQKLNDFLVWFLFLRLVSLVFFHPWSPEPFALFST